MLTCLLVLIGGCTAHTTDGRQVTPGPRSSSGSSSSASSSTPARPAKPRITDLTQTWSWQPLGTSAKDSLLTTLDSVSVDAVRAYSVGVIAKRGADLSDYPTRVAAADLRTGKQLWAVDLPRADTTAVGLPEVIVVATSRNRGLVGLDPATGHTLWRRHDLGPGLHTPVVGRGSRLYATVESKTFDGIARLNPLTGAITARTSTVSSFTDLLLTDDTVVADESTRVTAFDTDLRTRKWQTTVPDTDEGHTAMLVGSVVVRVSTDSHAPTRAVSATTGQRSWARVIGDDFSASVAGGLLLLNPTGDVMTAVDPAHGGRTVWQTASPFARFGGTTVDSANLLACGVDLLSAELGTAALYDLVVLPKVGFADDGCIAPPLETQASSARPNLVLVVQSHAVYAFEATVADAPRSALDPYGRWGPADPTQCGVDPTRTRDALTEQFGGTWTLGTADPQHDCEWVSHGRTPHLTVQTVPLTGAAEARKRLDPHDPDGSCIRYATGGSEGRIALPGLPAGSGACYLTHYTDTTGKMPDALTGVSVKDGAYFDVFVEGFRYGTVREVKGPQKLVALLRALTS